ncbi:hypothetical protein JOB18_018614 [Solea senegalensis]|uniref:CCHC-type domain-containing protein n=1 Tax=Solea senegalensis TaxID=28829 RepID=A0AAV6PBC1_SOLSE|nr:hypothetical protein JOB18_018614 [Solea senegalensis]
MDICKASEEEELRRSGRQKNPTEKMLAFQREEAHKKEKRLTHFYELWKTQARKTREQLKSNIPENEIAALIDTLEEGMSDVIRIYMEIRDHLTPSSETRRRIDACEAVTRDIVRIAYERITGIDGEFDSEAVKQRLCELLNRDYARSIYGSTASPSSRHSSQNSVSSIVTAKRADAAADLAAKEAEYEGLLEEERQKEKIQLLEEKQRKELETQKRELERLKAEKDIRAARARLITYNKEVMQEASVLSTDHSIGEQRYMSLQQPVSSAPIQQPAYVTTTSSPPQTDVTYLAQVVQDSITLNRLPMPEPSLFTGDPIQFIEWKASFISLIDKRNISSADKLHYLRKYVGGPARKTLDGIFYRSDDNAYKDAWNRLNGRYGQPFIIQRAFREKLAKWPRIQPKDAEGLRTFADFLHSCQEAIPHVKGLDILNDCEENQKLIQKLPDWAASQWNRKVTQSLKDRQEFPNFQDFVGFMLMEAEIACNPITSFQALHSSQPSVDKHYLKERKSKSSVFHTQTVTEAETPEQLKTDLKPPCMFCQDCKHRLHCCPGFKRKSLDERRKYVKEKRLCFGCLKPGHNAKDCRHRHSCDSCKGRHPTLLHDDGYTKTKTIPVPNQISGDEAATTLSLSVETEEPSANTSMIVPVWVSSISNPDEAIQLAKEAQELCSMGGLRLHKFVCNNRSVLDSIPPTEHATEVKAPNLAFNDSTLERALGIHWHIESDTFRFRVCLKDQPATRRGILSTVASLYDPLGFVAPFLLTGKKVLQEMCRHGTSWDDPLPSELQPVWERWKNDLANLEEITIPRCYVPVGFGKVMKKELHHFSDASTYGYGQCSYLRYVNEDEGVHCALVMGKSRVAPIKVTTIPRLELTAAVVSVAASNTLKEELGLADIDEYFWTDSKVVLGYINNEARRFHTFVSNRVQKIHLSTAPQQWRYVSTNNNPADLASRGSNASEILTSRWLSGPHFLWEKEIPPAVDVVTEVQIGDPEVKRIQTLHTWTSEQVSLSDRLSRFSTWSRATQAIARLIRRARGDKSTDHSTVQEREDAWCIIIKDLQTQVYPEEIKLLKRVDPSPPFTYCGMDCFSPFLTKHGRKVQKRYGLLFTCLCCRAIHIEMLDDMSTDAFINGLRCFIAIRGAVRQLKSDQGSNFIGAKNELNEALKQVDTNRLTTFLADRQCDFSMNAPHSSHVGGVWERQIRTVKNVLRSTLSLSPGRLDDSSLRTFFYEAMAIVNSRPLTVDNLSDPKSPEPLTPNHLLTMKSITALPPPGRFIREDMYARKRWRHVQYLSEQFWSRWRKEYLFNIATRQRWHTPRRNLKVGDIVMEKADDLPRNEWKLAKVIETVTDTDGLVRKVKIRVGDQKMGKEGHRSGKPSIVERPVQKLILLLETV